MMADNRVNAADVSQLWGCDVGAVVCGDNWITTYANYDMYICGTVVRDLEVGEVVNFNVDYIGKCGGYAGVGFTHDICGWDDTRGCYVAVHCYEADVPRFMWYE